MGDIVMGRVSALIEFKLLNWSTLVLGWNKGWADRKDAMEYAAYLLVNGSDTDEVAVIAGGADFSDEALLEFVSQQVENSDNAADLEKWLLVHLVEISELDEGEQTKLDRLQEVYADFNYPEEMAPCSIYSQSEIEPLVAMEQAIEQLKRKLAYK